MARMEVGRPVMKPWRLTERTPTCGPEDLASIPSSAADGMSLGEAPQPNSLGSLICEMKDYGSFCEIP